jgi:formylglycine-generating enzyme required for sulfatase activity
MSLDKVPHFNIALVQEQMAEIPGGSIYLRDDRTRKEWTTEIRPFLLAKYQLTQDLYFQITEESPSAFRGEKLPVETVSWKNAIEFCNLLSVKAGLETCYSINTTSEEMDFYPDSNGFRLPSEAEWEYACRAGSGEIRYGDLDRIAWYKLNSGGTSHETGLKEPNAWGLYDMLGNVWEWCSDIYDETVYGSYRIFRGGGWNDEARGVMATNRRRSHPTAFKIDDLGFRIAKNK